MMMAKKHTPKEGRFAQAKSFKTDKLIELREVMHKLEKLFIHMHDLTDEELEAMWPNVAETGLQTGGINNVHAKAKRTDKEFLISLIANQHHTVEALKFAQEKAQLDLKAKSTQNAVQQMASQIARGH